MKLFKKIMLITCSMLFMIPAAAKADTNLPADVQAAKAAYDTFGALIKKYDAWIIKQVNDQEERIKTLKFPVTPFTLADDETAEITIPSDLFRVMSTFDRINIYGSGFKSTDFIEGISPTKGNMGSVSSPWIADNHYQIRTTTFTTDHIAELARGDEAYSGYKLLLTGPMYVKSIDFSSENGVSMTMDTTAWEVLGGDKEILDDIAVTVDATSRLSIAGITTFEEDKFKRHAGNLTGGDTYKTAEYYTSKNYLPGRQIYKFGPALEIGYNPALPKLKEDPNKPGYATYEILDHHFANNASDIQHFDALFGKNLEYVLCFDNWPSWYVEGPDVGRGTPAVENFDAAADLVAKYIASYDKHFDGRGPTWVEVKNESTILSEWSHHDNPDPYYGWQVLADFHNKVADAVKAESPDVLVGGPTAAWMALDHANFDQAKKNLDFMSATAQHLDFYSYHFYESKDLILHDTVGNYVGYLTGRLEADLDLLQNYMINNNIVKPLVISETGTLHNGFTDPDYWIILKNYNGYMVRYMNRANEFDMVVPFILPAMWWDKEAPEALWAYGPNGKLIPTVEEGLTPIHYFLEMWDEYTGDLLPAATNDVNNNIYVHSTQNDNVIYVAVTNMNAQRANIDLNILLDGQIVEKIERTTTYLDMGKLYFVDNEPIDSLKDIFMHVEETSIFKITLDHAPNTTTTITKNTYYGDTILQDTGSPANFVIPLPTANIQSSVLRVSLGRDDGFKVPLNVSINGYAFEEYDLSFTDKNDRYFGYVDFTVPSNILKATNEITVSVDQSGGKISTVALINMEK
ncbi:beta-agarase [Candidatus Epulonipiscium viviparus]|uniref:beta-agarase n=1 Tax=Candidatus Epulonipiscium viviparus TaxID=420336 RepID=UPI002738071A|nr:beta-agarase [Candidatus Epulopiscium viviparus]